MNTHIVVKAIATDDISQNCFEGIPALNSLLFVLVVVLLVLVVVVVGASVVVEELVSVVVGGSVVVVEFVSFVVVVVVVGASVVVVVVGFSVVVVVGASVVVVVVGVCVSVHMLPPLTVAASFVPSAEEVIPYQFFVAFTEVSSIQLAAADTWPMVKSKTKQTNNIVYRYNLFFLLMFQKF